jgi:RimJ/RimL family protein N-acetyltransferase
MQNQEKWFESLQDGRNIMFGIETKPKRYATFIGVCGLCYIDQHNRSAEISYYVGNKRYDLKYDKEIIKLLLKYGFEELGLHRIYAECYEFAQERMNEAEKCGFQREGLMRDVVFRHGKFWNSVMLSILEGKR